MKLNSEAPEQQLAILFIGGFCVLLSLLSMLGSGGDDAQTEEQETQLTSYVETGITKYKNPKLSWYERIFCRGYQRSASCSPRLVHPMRSKMEELGIEINDAPAGDPNAIDYNGSLPVNRAISGRIRMENRPWEQPAWMQNR